MSRGSGKIEYEELHIGNGLVATREYKARVSLTITLHRGDAVRQVSDEWIDLGRRETIAGVRYGIEGMRLGGRRRIVVPPHLAYGGTGVPSAAIPPHAILICEVELHELRPREELGSTTRP